MKITQKEFDQDALSLLSFGMLPEEIEAYFEFFNQEVEIQTNKRVRILNSRKTKSAGKK